jgi:CubicO group peptidase (beta-lactamase class C family)
MRPHAAAWLLLLSAASGSAADAPRDVTAVLAPVRAKHDLPAMAGAIVSAGELEAIGADGVRERGKPEKATARDLWHLGSCTKAMTATLCARLVEEKKLAWTTTVGEVFADVKGIDPAWKPVTLEQLLTNHAGAPANLDADGLWGRLWKSTGTPQEARRALVEGVLEHPPESKPGTKYVYSNAGFSIAGAMAETVAKEPYETLIAKRLFEPLGMESAGFGAPGSAGAVDQPRGHGADGKPVAPGPSADNPAAIAPAGRVHCTIGDWAKFVALHVRGERKDGSKLLAPATFAKLHAPVADDAHYAMGWIVTDREWAGGRALTHSGSNTMWYCTTWIAPDRDFAVLVTTNQGGDEAAKACDEACWALIQDHLAHAKGAGTK